MKKKKTLLTYLAIHCNFKVTISCWPWVPKSYF